MLQMAGIGQMPGKILQTHTGVVHNVSVNNSGIVRGGDSLGSNGNTKNFVFRLLVFFNKVLDFVSDLLVIRSCV